MKSFVNITAIDLMNAQEEDNNTPKPAFTIENVEEQIAEPPPKKFQ